MNNESRISNNESARDRAIDALKQKWITRHTLNGLLVPHEGAVMCWEEGAYAGFDAGAKQTLLQVADDLEERFGQKTILRFNVMQYIELTRAKAVHVAMEGNDGK